jgi:hypothetical protein
MARQVEFPKLLLVEGRDEEEFFASLLTYLDISDVAVWAIQGKSRLSSRLKALVSAPHTVPIVSVGIVQDADNDPAAAFQSICTALDAADLPVPEAPLQPHGVDPRITVMIVPDAATPGMLEDVCLASVGDDPATECVDAFFRCLQERMPAMPQNQAKARLRAFLSAREWLEEEHFQLLQDQALTTPALDANVPIAKLHAFLASRYKPDLRLGTAAKAGYWPLHDDAFQPFRDFLQML